MATTRNQRLGIFLALALVMAITRGAIRLYHFEVFPDASWAVFFLAGFWLSGAARWVFPALMAEAVLVDYLVISGQGLSFWSHYCVSPAYWFLVAAYGALWLGGRWAARRQGGLRLSTLGLAAAALLVSEAVCFVVSNGSFYWLSPAVPGPRSMGAWFSNMGDWYLPFLQVTALYVGLGAMLHVLAVQLLRAPRHAGQAR